MKKLLFLFLSVVFAFVLLPKNVFALDVQSDVEYLALGNKYTQEATCISFGQYCVLGVRTCGILLASEEDKYMQELTDGIKQVDGNLQKIYITKDLGEVLLIKDVRQKLDGGMGLMEVYNYIQTKYPKAIDKIKSQL